MSKRVQRYECDECHESYADKPDADACERQHIEDREREAQEAAWARFAANYSWRFTVEQIRELTDLAESWHGRALIRRDNQEGT